ncbi:MAG: hypothetical protein MZU95_06765 [Desulfomicrobium escambiense]|nr:hypothetical protein [Desulfomicrobium escambiense]
MKYVPVEFRTAFVSGVIEDSLIAALNAAGEEDSLAIDTGRALLRLGHRLQHRPAQGRFLPHLRREALPRRPLRRLPRHPGR